MHELVTPLYIMAYSLLILTVFSIVALSVIIFLIVKLAKVAGKIERSVDTLNTETKKRVEKFDSFVESLKDMKNLFQYSKQAFEFVQNWKKDKNKPKKNIDKDVKEAE